MAHLIGFQIPGKKPVKSIHLIEMEEMRMPINPEALEKVKMARMGGMAFSEVLNTLAATLGFTGAAESHLTFDYQHKDIKVRSGDLIPYITIGLRQATIEDQVSEIVADAEAQVEANEVQAANDS